MSVPTQPSPRQTIPFGDRPFVDMRSGRLTSEAYQFLQRMSGGGGAATQNVVNVITQSNSQDAQIAALGTTVAGQGAEIAALETRVAQTAEVFPPALPAAIVAGDRPMPPAPPAVLPVSRGGTGQSAAPGDGQLLIGNGGGAAWNFGTVTAGHGVTITNGPGAITIAATFTTADFAALDLSTLPVANPGGGKPWLSGTVVSVG